MDHQPPRNWPGINSLKLLYARHYRLGVAAIFGLLVIAGSGIGYGAATLSKHSKTGSKAGRGAQAATAIATTSSDSGSNVTRTQSTDGSGTGNANNTTSSTASKSASSSKTQSSSSGGSTAGNNNSGSTTGGSTTATRILGGAYEGADDPDGVDWFGQTYLKQSVSDYALDFEASDTWANISGPHWLLGPWADSNYAEKLILSVPMLPSSSGTVSLATGATGAYNSYFQALAENLVDDGMDKTIIRLGWEFNGGWYAWAANGKTADYINYWRQVVDTMRAVSGQHFTFLWNPTNGYQQFPAANAYPGDSYVDYIGDDVYNQSWISNYTDATARWNDIYNGNNGLAYWVSFASQHAKPIVFPEWGTGTRSDGHGGGDDPSFIQNMYDVMTSTNTGFESYWDYCASDYCGELDKSPNSAAEFIRLFGG